MTPTLPQVERPMVQVLVHIGRSTLPVSDGVGLIGTLEGNMVEYATQWSVGSLTLIILMSTIRRYVTDGKKKGVGVKNETEKCRIIDIQGVIFWVEIL